MNKIIIRNVESEKGKAIWGSVDSTAEKAPEWVKTRIMSAPVKRNQNARSKYIEVTIKYI